MENQVSDALRTFTAGPRTDKVESRRDSSSPGGDGQINRTIRTHAKCPFRGRNQVLWGERGTFRRSRP